VPYCRKFDFPTCEDPSLAIELSDEFTKRKLPACQNSEGSCNDMTGDI
jgi:hypothetical protein